MTNHETCTYPGDREGAIIDYLYGESDAAARAAFERHITDCTECRADVEAYRGVRHALAGWAPPERAGAAELSPMLTGPRLAVSKDAAPSSLVQTGAPPPARQRLATMPTWARVAAAVLCVGIGAGAANLRVTYSSDGLTVRTGWLTDAGAEPWRAEVAALTSQIRALQSPDVARVADTPVADDAAARQDSATAGGRDQGAGTLGGRVQRVGAVAGGDPGGRAPGGRDQGVGAPGSRDQGVGAPGSRDQGVGAPGVIEDAFMKQVRTLIARSEQRQQRELALRLGDALNDVQAQRRADLARIDRTIGVMQSSTGMDLLRQREAINTLAVRVSSQR